MLTPILATKLYIAPPRPGMVVRSRLLARLDEALQRKLTLVSAPAGFGKTTLLNEWVAASAHPVAWLSLDEADNDPYRLLMHLIAALQTLMPEPNPSLPRMFQSPQPPPIEIILTALLNDLSTLPHPFVLILDDYHVLDSRPVDDAFTFLLDYLPPHMHLIIATREDPQFPLARLRARGQLTELRVTELRFNRPEAAGFLNQMMELNLSADDIAALETRTEGWIAGLQLAAISMQGQADTAAFIRSFTGSHHFVMDYLVEEVLGQQSEDVQTFLLHTSILDRLCGPLCEAVVGWGAGSGQETLTYLQHANLFIVPLDNERRWFRYHHLFADLLRGRLRHSLGADAERQIDGLHLRASQWYEDNGLDLEAFHHSAAAHDIPRTERLIDRKGILLHLGGTVTAILNWMGSLPREVMDARPSLWARYGAMLLVNGHTTGVDEKLNAAEAAIDPAANDDATRQTWGLIHTARATLALTRYQIDGIFRHAQLALDTLDASKLTLRANVHWTLGFAYGALKDYTSARRVLTEAIALSQQAGDPFTYILATIGLGQLQESEYQLYQSAETFRHVVQLAGDQPQQIIGEAHIGLARIQYEWNDLDAAEKHARQSLALARQYDSVIDRYIFSEVFLARLKLARGNVDAAAAMLAQSHQAALEKNFIHRLPDIAAAQVLTLIRQHELAEAAHVAQTHSLPLSQARVFLAQADPDAALIALEPLREQFSRVGWVDEALSLSVLLMLAHQQRGDTAQALSQLEAALRVAEPGGFIRLFIDEGPPMAALLAEAAARGILPGYIGRLLAAFEAQAGGQSPGAAHGLIEPLSPRELEVLRLIAHGLSNQEISARLFLALDTVKGHNRRIFDKLDVQRRTEAVARARELGLL